jgi:hypothetical protein
LFPVVSDKWKNLILVSSAVKTPNGLALSGLADFAGLPSLYLLPRQRAYQRKRKAEGQFRCSAWLGGIYFLYL